MSRLSQPEIGTLRRLLSKGIARMHHMKNGTELHLCQSVAKLRSLDPLNHVLNSQGDGGPDSANRTTLPLEKTLIHANPKLPRFPRE